MDLANFRLADFVTVANLLVLLGLWRKISIFTYQHNLMWQDFAKKKGLVFSAKSGGDD